MHARTTLGDGFTSLHEPISVDRDWSRYPMPGQLSLPLSAAGYREASAEATGYSESNREWLARMVRTHGHCSQ